jgi:hypothetical protein
MRVSTHSWVCVTTAWRLVRLRMEDQSSVWRAAANILNKQSRRLTRGGPLTWCLGEMLTTSHRKNWPRYETNTRASVLD